MAPAASILERRRWSTAWEWAVHVRVDLSKTPLARASRVEAEVEAPTGQLSSENFDVNAPARTVLIYRIR